MIRVFLRLRWALIAVALLCLHAAGEVPEFLVKGPWAGLTGDAVAISFELSEPVGGVLRYGPAGAGPAFSADFGAREGIRRLYLTDLRPGSTYVYTIEFETGDRAPAGRFRTPPREFRPFTFLVYGDTRTFYDRHRLVTERMAREEAAFVVHTGDLVTSPMGKEWERFFSSGRELFLSMLFLPVIGNHERNHFSYYDLFELPGAGGKEGKQWWSLWWGDVLFVGLDSNLQYLGLAGLREQTAWLEEVLSREARFKFVFFHHPLFSSDIYHGGNKGLAAMWHPIFVENGVDAVFCGHVHAYEHIVRDGVHYFITGGGGAPMYPLGEPVEGAVFAAEGILHFLRVTVGKGEVEIEMVPVARAPLGGEEGPVTPLEGVPLEVCRIGAGAPVEAP